VPHVIALVSANPDDPSLPGSSAARWSVAAYVAGELTGIVRARDDSFDGYVESTLFVHVKWRRQGIGTLLLEAAMDWALSRQACALRLVCARTDWPMRHFVEKSGARLDLAFGQIVADIPLGYDIGDRRFPLPRRIAMGSTVDPGIGASEVIPERRS
jgi:GNAT superfamily N-acetyltransferase